LAALRIEASDPVRVLHGEPEDAALIEDQRVRILGLRIRHLVLRDLAVFGVQLADERAGVAGVPDVALAILDEPVRAGMRRLERILFYGAALRVHATEHVRHLSRVPERSVARRHWIVRARARR